MHLLASLTTFLLTVGAYAAATPRGWGGPSGRRHGGNGWAPAPGACLNSTGVHTLVEGYTYLLEHPGGPDFNTTADAILSATNFTVQSDSILTLSGRSLGQLAYPSKQVYIATQNETPPLPVVSTLSVFATCDKISWRWVATGLGALEVRGLIVFDVDPVRTQIVTVYSEFNTGAFETDIGQ